jgi:ribosomal-protein-alanine N-acetyltransferase
VHRQLIASRNATARTAAVARVAGKHGGLTNKDRDREGRDPCGAGLRAGVFAYGDAARMIDAMDPLPVPLPLLTERLLLRRPGARDAEAVFARYASDPEVTRYLSFPTHRSIDDARAFVQYSDAEWARWQAGPLLIEARSDGTLLGGTGLMFETPQRAMTGYVLAKTAWGRGYATEALTAIAALASRLGVRRLFAHCHTDHHASVRVLEKCGFEREGVLRAHSEFPNLRPGEPLDVFVYARLL